MESSMWHRRVMEDTCIHTFRYFSSLVFLVRGKYEIKTVSAQLFCYYFLRLKSLIHQIMINLRERDTYLSCGESLSTKKLNSIHFPWNQYFQIDLWRRPINSSLLLLGVMLTFLKSLSHVENLPINSYTIHLLNGNKKVLFFFNQSLVNEWKKKLTKLIEWYRAKCASKAIKIVFFFALSEEGFRVETSIVSSAR